jgi:hypothetical protein
MEPDSNSSKPDQSFTDEEALAAIDKLEAEDNPSIEPEIVQKPFQTIQSAPQQPLQPPVNTFTPTPVTKNEMISNSEKPIISGPKKSSKLLIVVLIFLIVLIIGGTVAYLKSTNSL